MKKKLIKIFQLAKSLYYFVLGNIFILIKYDRKYIKGRYFKLGGMGYRWVVNCFFYQCFLGRNTLVPWPVSPYVMVTGPKNIIFDPNDMHIFHTGGTYFQAINEKLYIGTGVYIAPNVGIITTNHNINNLDIHDSGKEVIIGNKCWIGMNSVILPGVVLGDNTIVGAGSVVTKSFVTGNCIIAGNPAKVIKNID